MAQEQDLHSEGSLRDIQSLADSIVTQTLEHPTDLTRYAEYTSDLLTLTTTPHTRRPRDVSDIEGTNRQYLTVKHDEIGKQIVGILIDNTSQLDNKGSHGIRAQFSTSSRGKMCAKYSRLIGSQEEVIAVIDEGQITLSEPASESMIQSFHTYASRFPYRKPLSNDSY